MNNFTPSAPTHDQIVARIQFYYDFLNGSKAEDVSIDDIIEIFYIVFEELLYIQPFLEGVEDEP